MVEQMYETNFNFHFLICIFNHDCLGDKNYCIYNIVVV